MNKKNWPITSRIELLLAKIAGRDVDLNTMTPPVASNTTEEMLLEIADRLDNGGSGGSGLPQVGANDVGSVLAVVKRESCPTPIITETTVNVKPNGWSNDLNIENVDKIIDDTEVRVYVDDESYDSFIKTNTSGVKISPFGSLTVVFNDGTARIYFDDDAQVRTVVNMESYTSDQYFNIGDSEIDRNAYPYWHISFLATVKTADRSTISVDTVVNVANSTSGVIGLPYTVVSGNSYSSYYKSPTLTVYNNTTPRVALLLDDGGNTSDIIWKDVVVEIAAEDVFASSETIATHSVKLDALEYEYAWAPVKLAESKV